MKSYMGHRCRAAVRQVEILESRWLLSATVLSPIPPQTIFSGTGGATLNLSTYFNDPDVDGTVVQFQTNVGAPLDFSLFDALKPVSVANFLMYVNAGTYNGTIIHHSASFFGDQSNTATPVSIIQGGAFNTSFNSVTPSNATGIVNEASTNGVISNLTGTLAFSRTSGPDSATSQWFINTTDNPSLDPNPNSSDPSQKAGYAVFGKLINGTLATAEAIANIPRYDVSADNIPNSPVFTQLPANNYSQAQANANIAPSPPDLVVITSASVLPALTYGVTSDAPDLVSASIVDGNLTLTANADAGSANVTVTATDSAGNTVMSNFPVIITKDSLTDITLGAGGPKSLTYTDTNGTTGVLTLKGAGSAVVHLLGMGISPTTTSKGIVVHASEDVINGIDITGTNANASLTLTTKGGTKSVNVGTVNTTAIKSFAGKGVTITGNFTSLGPIGSMTLAGMEEGTFNAPSVRTLSTGTFSDALQLTASSGVSLGKFSANSLSGGPWSIAAATMSITASTATNWTSDFSMPVKNININGDMSGTITATTIGTLKIGGSLTAVIGAASIANLIVKKRVDNSALHFTALGTDLGRFVVGGDLSNSQVNVLGSIGSVSAASLTDSTIFAGIGPLASGQQLPQLGDFVSSEKIGSVNLKTARTGDSFSNSEIAAESLGHLSLGNILTSNADPTGGIAAHSIGALSATANKKFGLKNLGTGTDLGTLLMDDGVVLGDFSVDLL